VEILWVLCVEGLGRDLYRVAGYQWGGGGCFVSVMVIYYVKCGVVAVYVCFIQMIFFRLEQKL
jgi:hypothetical protein